MGVEGYLYCSSKADWKERVITRSRSELAQAQDHGMESIEP